MIVSNDSVNAIALPYVWQLTDNYGYTHYSLQTNTLSQMVAIHSSPDFDDLPRGQHKWERGQRWMRPRTRPRLDTTRPRSQNLALRPCWPQGLNIPADNQSTCHPVQKTLALHLLQGKHLSTPLKAKLGTYALQCSNYTEATVCRASSLIFTIPQGPCCCRKLGYRGPPHLFFCNTITECMLCVI